MSYLQTVLAELSTEVIEHAPELDKEALLDYAIESAQSEITRALVMCSKLHQLYESYSTESISLATYRDEVHVTFITAGLTLPVDLIVPSFESESKEEDKKKSEGVIKKTLVWLKEMIDKLVTWVKSKFKSTGQRLQENISKLKAQLEGKPDYSKTEKGKLKVLTADSLKIRQKTLQVIKERLDKPVFSEEDVQVIQSCYDEFLDDYTKRYQRVEITFPEFNLNYSKFLVSLEPVSGIKIKFENKLAKIQDEINKDAGDLEVYGPLKTTLQGLMIVSRILTSIEVDLIEWSDNQRSFLRSIRS